MHLPNCRAVPERLSGDTLGLPALQKAQQSRPWPAWARNLAGRCLENRPWPLCCPFSLCGWKALATVPTSHPSFPPNPSQCQSTGAADARLRTCGYKGCSRNTQEINPVAPDYPLPTAPYQVRSNTTCKKLSGCWRCWMPLPALGHQRSGAFAETPLRYSHRVLFHRDLPRHTAFRGQDGGRVSRSVSQRSG